MGSTTTDAAATAKQRFRILFLATNFFLWVIPLVLFTYVPYNFLTKPIVMEFSVGIYWIITFILILAGLLYVLGLFGYLTGSRMTRIRFKAYIGLAAISFVLTFACMGCFVYYDAYTNYQSTDYQTFWDEQDKRELQLELGCCGFSGVSDYNDTTTYPASCYDSTGALQTNTCNGELQSFAQEIAIVFLALIVVLLVAQLMGLVTAILILKRLQASSDESVLGDQSDSKVKQTYKIITSPQTD